MKAISEYLGHHSPKFTEETYVYQEKTVYNCTLLSEIWKILASEEIDEDHVDEFDIPFTDEDYYSMLV